MLDISIIFLIAALTHFIFAIVGFTLFKLSRDRSAQLWVLACICSGLANLTVALNELIPDWFVYSISSSIAILGIILAFYAFDLFLFKRALAVAPIYVICSLWGIFAGLLYLNQMLVPRIVMVTLVWSGSFFYFSWYFFKKSHKHDHYIFLLSMLFALLGAVWLTRGLTGILLDYHYIDAPMVSNSVFVLLNLMLTSCRNFLYLVIRYASTSKEKDELIRLSDEKDLLISSLINANKTIETSALSTTLAHEINQPLTAMKIGLANLNLKINRGTQSRDDLLTEIRHLNSDCDRATKTVQVIRQIFQKDHNVKKTVNLNQVVTDTLSIIRNDLEKHRVICKLQLVDDASVDVNTSEIQQVLLNLFKNSIEAFNTSVNNQREIVLRLESDGTRTKLLFQDNGPGIPPEMSPVIFDLLKSNKSNGSGIGLWLSKFLIERNQARIRHEATPRGGATFILEFENALKHSNPRNLM